jgi:hypothetical protein
VAANKFSPIAKCVTGATNAGKDVFRLGFPVNDEIRRAWDIVSNTRGAARRSLGRPLVEGDYEHKLEGTVIARGSFARRLGPVSTEMDCADGAVWVIDYDEQRASSMSHWNSGLIGAAKSAPSSMPFDCVQ